jgi:hypothetical protein
MHDWTLLRLTVDWETGEAVLDLVWAGSPAQLRAHEVREIRVPRAFPWGPSVSVNKVYGPTQGPDGASSFKIEMQSGDIIEIIAKSFDLPSGARKPA